MDLSVAAEVIEGQVKMDLDFGFKNNVVSQNTPKEISKANTPNELPKTGQQADTVVIALGALAVLLGVALRRKRRAN